MDKFSYAIGLGIGQNLLSMGTKGIEVDDFAQAIKDILEGNKTAISHAEARDIVNKYFAELEEKMNAASIEQGVQFLEENKKRPNVVTLPSGLQYKIITKGTGAIPADTSKVKVNYKGTLIDGTEFDSSYKRNEPATFRANQVIKGWTEALTMMPVGSKWELYIPQELGYGGRETGGQIKPFSTLIFEVELVGIEK